MRSLSFAILFSACSANTYGLTKGHSSEITGTTNSTMGPISNTTVAGETTSSDEPTGEVSDSGNECRIGGHDCLDSADCCGCLECLDGICESLGACPTCTSCRNDGSCKMVDPGEPCEPASDPCPDTVWGLDDGVCYAAASSAGSCDELGVCENLPCTDKGAVIFSCPECLRSDHACFFGTPVRSLTLADVCHLGGIIPSCSFMCTGEAEYTLSQCSPDGECVPDQIKTCHPYICVEENSSCKQACSSDLECVDNYHCNGSACVPD